MSSVFLDNFFQVELHKTQISDLHTKLMETEKRSDKAEFDAQRSKEKLLSIEAENEVDVCFFLLFRIFFLPK